MGRNKALMEQINLLRPITTAYIEGGVVVKRFTSKNPNAAMMRAGGHMNMNHYGASVCQVYATGSMRLYGEIKRRKDGRIITTHQEDPTTFDDPLRRDPTRAWAAFV